MRCPMLMMRLLLMEIASIPGRVRVHVRGLHIRCLHEQSGLRVGNMMRLLSCRGRSCSWLRLDVWKNVGQLLQDMLLGLKYAFKFI